MNDKRINTVVSKMQLTKEDLLENFEFLSDWEDRYAYLIELGKNVQPLDDHLKNENTLVKGCTSQVWLVAETAQSKSGFISFKADSDAHIVRGLIAILMTVYNDQPVEFIKNFPIDDFFSQLGLASHLSPNRRNGFFAMVGRIKSLADL